MARGECVSRGIAIGYALVFKPINLAALEKVKLPIESGIKEIERLDKAVGKTVDQIYDVLHKVGSSINFAQIVQVQMEILNDIELFREIKTAVHEQKVNIEYALSRQIRLLEERFLDLNSEVMRSRIIDIQDIYYRILRNLLDIDFVRSNPMKLIADPVILVSEKLLPTDIALLDRDKILGIIVEETGLMSHVAIITKALRIPAITKIPGISSYVRTGDRLILDALEGTVLINPEAVHVSEYTIKKEKLSAARQHFKFGRSIPVCKTVDGIAVTLNANVATVFEANHAVDEGADGIGLLRTEMFYMSNSRIPSEEEEYSFYASLLSIMKDKPVTIRLLDLGADKRPDYISMRKEDNPQLGLRGIRFLLKRPELLTRQLKAIVRASAITPVRLLIPFVSIADDVRETLTVIAAACRAEKIDRTRIKVGIMVEVPLVALSIGAFLPYVDFITIGTNDLMQYVLAADRENNDMEKYHQAMHPVILKMIKTIVVCAQNGRKEVSLCGEIASQPTFAPLLVGLGIRSISVQPSSLAHVRQAIGTCSYKSLKKTAKKAMRMETVEDVLRLLRPPLID